MSRIFLLSLLINCANPQTLKDDSIVNSWWHTEDAGNYSGLCFVLCDNYNARLWEPGSTGTWGAYWEPIGTRKVRLESKTSPVTLGTIRWINLTEDKKKIFYTGPAGVFDGFAIRDCPELTENYEFVYSNKDVEDICEL